MSLDDEPIYLEPETERILKETLDAKPLDRSAMEIAEAREQMETASKIWNQDLPKMAEARDFTIEGPGGAITLRLLRPEVTATKGVIVYFHGGGFVLGSLESHHRLMRLLAIRSEATLLGVDYRLAPDDPFPSALEDGLAAIRWLRAHGTELDLDPDRMVLAGDSAGANLALACLLRLRDAGEPPPSGGGLFYGCYWARLGTQSHQKFGGGGYRLSSAEMGWFWNHYLGETGKGDVYAEPMDAPLEGLPPLFLNYGEVDPLADDTRELVMRLDRAGVVHDCIAYPGLVHGFLQMSARVEPAAKAIADAGSAFKDMLG